MTGLVGAAANGRILMVADAACYRHDTGEAIGFARKILPLPGTLAVFCCRGPANAWPAFDEACRKAKLRSIDDFIARADAIFADTISRLGEEASHAVDVVVAGWSASRRQALLLLQSNHDAHGVPAGALATVRAFCSVAEQTIDPAQFTVERGVELLELQRLTPASEISGGPELTTVGGWVDAVEIRAGARPVVRRVHEWPEDVVGAALAA
ncbi:hypothetical protein [Chenggangzhangella methanolivorans]|uniref:Uncharacterized protein n=1 Tax=Chenggangzhangella methanolivorans TaxID=1437009 RepID=A0A9E6RIK8_9HYPH|nr:hypothetical protein [Chenggangzhangella methanolivorans]QZO01657.1 hypothetical protein K6K41_09805 [Chenggangzhangella methanolivorans]